MLLGIHAFNLRWKHTVNTCAFNSYILYHYIHSGVEVCMYI